MNINLKQALAIAGAVLAVLAVSTAQLTDIVGLPMAKTIVSMAGLLNAVISSVLAVISSQAGLVADVQAMPGVEKITVNAQANQTLAGMAMSDNNPKVRAEPGNEAAVNEAAKG